MKIDDTRAFVREVLDDVMRTSTETTLARFALAVLDALDEVAEPGRNTDLRRFTDETVDDIRAVIARNLERK